jgi:hypothetical protein
LRIVRAVVIYRTHSTLLLICQGARQPHATANGKVLLAVTENLPGDLSLKTLLEAIAVLCKKAAGEVSAPPGKTRSPD